MLENIDINKMNRLMEENKDAKEIITGLAASPRFPTLCPLSRSSKHSTRR